MRKNYVFIINDILKKLKSINPIVQMKKELIFILLFSFGISNNYCQQILLEEDVSQLYNNSQERGANKKHFTHFYFGYGVVAGNTEGEQMNLEPLKSNDMLIGYRYKRKLTNWYAMGLDVFYERTAYHIKQDAEKRIPNSIQHEKEKIIYSYAGASYYQRFNIGKRGNRIGNFIDIGAYSAFAFSVRHVFKDAITERDAYKANQMKRVNKHLDYIDRLNYGLQVRIGFNHLILYGTYRLSDIFNNEFDTEPARIIAGICIGLHK